MKILKMQQGGMITAPNPQPYRVPLAGLNADAFRYNLSTSPLDTSGMVQVLQFQEGADLRRQQQAMELEKKRIEKEIAEAKLDFQNKKLAFDLIKDINKASKSVGGGTLDLNGNPFNPDLTNTIYFSDKYKKPLETISQMQSEIDRLSVELTPENAIKIQSFVNKIAALRQNMSTDTELKVETLIGEKLNNLLSGDVKSGQVVNPFVLQSAVTRRKNALDNHYSTDYIPGNPANLPSYLVVNEKNEQDKFDKALTSVLSSFSTDEINFQTYGNTGNAIVKTTKKEMVFDNPTALNNLAEMVVNDKSLASYLSSVYGANLFKKDPNISNSNNDYIGDGLVVDLDLVKNLLKSNVGPLIDAEEGKAKAIDMSAQIGSANVVPKKFDFNYNTNRTEKRETTAKVDFNNPSGSGGGKSTPKSTTSGKPKSNSSSSSANTNNITKVVDDLNKVEDLPPEIVDMTEKIVNSGDVTVGDVKAVKNISALSNEQRDALAELYKAFQNEGGVLTREVKDYIQKNILSKGSFNVEDFYKNIQGHINKMLDLVKNSIYNKDRETRVNWIDAETDSSEGLRRPDIKKSDFSNRFLK